jgi:ABC-type transport system involved in cytochrome bd biosynthesis fused ATPase/permease subunit
MIFFLKRAGYFVYDHWKIFAIALGVIVLVVLFYEACGKKTPKLNQEQIIKSQQAIAKEDRKEMLEVLAESDAQEKAAETVQANAEAVKEQTIKESKEKWSNASNDEMAAELERRAKE